MKHVTMDTCTYSDGGGQATVSRTRGMIGCRNNKEETRTSWVSQGTASADFLFFFFIPFVIFAVLFSPSCSGRNSDPGSHSGLFSPLPTAVHALHFCREKTSALSSLVDSRRIARALAINRRSQQLLRSWSILFYFWKKNKILPR